ncbi:copper resistance CopC family protein [Kytococcus sp. Marseille-QA3725]
MLKRVSGLPRSLAAGAAVLSLSLSAASPALAHDVLEESDPAAGATLDEAPESLTFTYSDNIQRVGNKISVSDASGEVVAEGEPEVDGPEVSLPLPEDLPDGTYTTTWRVTSSDGHPISGTSDFTVGSGGEGSEDASAGGSPSAGDEGSAPASPSDSADSSDGASPSSVEDTASPEEGDEESSSGGGLGTGGWLGLGALALVLVGGGALLLRR